MTRVFSSSMCNTGVNPALESYTAVIHWKAQYPRNLIFFFSWLSWLQPNWAFRRTSVGTTCLKLQLKEGPYCLSTPDFPGPGKEKWPSDPRWKRELCVLCSNLQHPQSKNKSSHSLSWKLRQLPGPPEFWRPGKVLLRTLFPHLSNGILLPIHKPGQPPCSLETVKVLLLYLLAH